MSETTESSPAALSTTHKSDSTEQTIPTLEISPPDAEPTPISWLYPYLRELSMTTTPRQIFNLLTAMKIFTETNRSRSLLQTQFDSDLLKYWVTCFDLIKIVHGEYQEKLKEVNDKDQAFQEEFEEQVVQNMDAESVVEGVKRVCKWKDEVRMQFIELEKKVLEMIEELLKADGSLDGQK